MPIKSFEQQLYYLLLCILYYIIIILIYSVAIEYLDSDQQQELSCLFNFVNKQSRNKYEGITFSVLQMKIVKTIIAFSLFIFLLVTTFFGFS